MRLNSIPALAVAFLAAAFSVVAAPTTVAAETTLRLLSGWTPVNAFVPEIEAVFIKNVADASKGQIKINRRGPEVAAPFEQFQPVSSGVFDILYTTAGYHQGTTGVGVLAEIVKPDVKARRESGIVKWIDDYYQKEHNMKLLALIPAVGANILLRDPVGADGGLKGRKIRSIPNWDEVVRGLGGTPVSMPPSDAYASLQKGVIDGVAFPMMFAHDYKFHEVVRFMARPGFGNASTMFMMNLDRWNGLTPEEQKILEDEGRRIEQHGWDVSLRLMESDVKKMQDAGVKVSEFGAQYADKMQELFVDGLKATASKSSPAAAAEFVKFVEAKEMVAR